MVLLERGRDLVILALIGWWSVPLVFVYVGLFTVGFVDTQIRRTLEAAPVNIGPRLACATPPTGHQQRLGVYSPLMSSRDRSDPAIRAVALYGTAKCRHLRLIEVFLAAWDLL